MAPRAYSAETKAAALAEIANGNTPAYVARKYGLGVTTVQSWAKEQRREILPLKAARANLLTYEVFELVRLNIHAMKAMTEVASRPDYLEKQSARELAVLYGVLADKTYRVLAALQDGSGEAA